MSKGHFRFSTGIFRHLGEELNPHPDQGLIELVKNAYDADARNCLVEFHNTDQPGGWICIEDDGDGMEIGDIRSGWLVLGESRKSVGQRTRLGRIPAGSKGLGRLAALRLGSAASLWTRPRAHKSVQHEMRIDWREYEQIHAVDEIELEIVTARRQRKGSGTRIVIENLRNRFDRPSAKRLARQMILLADPFGEDKKGFVPHFSAPEFSDLEKIVKRRYFDDAEYRLAAQVDEEGRATAQVLDWRGEVLYSASHEDLGRDSGHLPYRCPVAEFELWVFLLSRDAFKTRQTSLTAVREWLGALGGVHIYYNGLRVNPYGNEGHDWLDMNLSRARSPEERPSTNTSIGRVRVEDVNGTLEQKTDRSGFIENETFLELRRFALDTLEWMATERLKAAERRRKEKRDRLKNKAIRAKDKIDETIQSVQSEQDREKISKALEEYEKKHEAEIRGLHEEVQLYRSLSTAGITAATFAHQSTGNPLKVLGLAIKTVERRAKEALSEEYSKLLEDPVQRIQRSTKSLSVLGNATLQLLDHEKRRNEKVHLHGVLEEVLKTFEPFLESWGVVTELELFEGDPFLHCSRAAIESIYINLINNSVAAFKAAARRRRKIRFVTNVASGRFLLRALDSGPGIVDIDIEDIWLPGKTTRPNGTGLGLKIVWDTTEDLRGSVDALATSDLGGAEIRVTLPILGC